MNVPHEAEADGRRHVDGTAQPPREPALRTVVRFTDETRRALDKRVGAIRAKSPAQSISRAGLIVAFVERGLVQTDDSIEIRRPRAAPPARRENGAASLREKILKEFDRRPGAVLTPALLAPLVGARNTDVVRNALLVLVAKGRIQKVGPGKYEALNGTAA